MRVSPFRLRIAARLTLAFVGLLLLLLASVVAAVWRVNGLSAEMRQAFDGGLLRLQETQSITSLSQDSARQLLVLIVAGRERRVATYARIDEDHRRTDAVVTHLQTQWAGQPELLKGLNDVRVAVADYRLAYGEIVDQIEAEDFDAARRLLEQRTEGALATLVQHSSALVAAQQEATAQTLAAAEAEIIDTRNTAIALGLLIALLGALLAWAASRSIVKPLHGVEKAALRIAAGDYSVRVATPGGDEVAEVGRALNHLACTVSAREEEIHQLANTDALTGLPRRPVLEFKGAALLASLQSSSTPGAVLCIDIERLKTINAVLGFDAGDAAVVAAAQRIKEALPTAGSLLVRLSGGTFAALLAPASAAMVRSHCEQLLNDQGSTLLWRGHDLDLTFSIGIALFPAQGRELSELLRMAEAALFESKRTRCGLSWYTPEREAQRRDQLSLLSDLHAGIEGGQLRQFLQAKHALSDGRLVGAEALVRWIHPTRGFIPPSEFIPFAEQAGRIGLVTHWMLHRALSTLAAWQKEGHALSIAVNVSTRDVQDPGFAARLGALLRETGAPAGQLTLEITETGLMDSGGDPAALIAPLAALGVSMSIDDFGTGHSSLSYLQRLPVSELKIDRSFVDGAEGDAVRARLLQSIVGLGHSLGMVVTAEGIENEAQLQLLRSAGCDQAQGYHLGRPVEDSVFTAALRPAAATPTALLDA
jgi:diguanylate cyclase (GGDEF)-like protein